MVAQSQEGSGGIEHRGALDSCLASVRAANPGWSNWMTRDHFLKNKLAMPTRRSGGDRAIPRIATRAAHVPMVLFQNEGKIFQVPADQWKPSTSSLLAVQSRTRRIVRLVDCTSLARKRHEAGAIDNQLRGRAGRQGDPGSSRFFLSLEDDLMRIFGGERVKALMFRLA